MKKVITSEGQSMIDIALQEYGDTSGVISSASINSLSVTHSLQTGTTLSVDDTLTVNKKIRDYYAEKDYKVNTGYVFPSTLPEGIHDDFHDQYHN